LLIAIAGGAVVLVPSLVLLFTLFLRGHLDSPDAAAPAAPAALAAGSMAPSTRSIGAAGAIGPSRAWGATAVAELVAGAGLLVFADAGWAQAIGVLCLVACAVATFWLAAGQSAQDRG
jgi:hypothetical protein